MLQLLNFDGALLEKSLLLVQLVLKQIDSSLALFKLVFVALDQLAQVEVFSLPHLDQVVRFFQIVAKRADLLLK